MAICSEGTVSRKTSLVHTCNIEFNDDKFRPGERYDAELQKVAKECHVDVQFGTNKKGRIFNIEAVVEGFWGRNYEPPSPNSCKRKATGAAANCQRRKKSPRSESDSGGNGEEDEEELDEWLDRLASDFGLPNFDHRTKVDEDVKFSQLADSVLTAKNSGRRKKIPRHSPVTTEVVPECPVEESVASGSDLSDNDEEEYEEDQLDPIPIGVELADLEFDDEKLDLFPIGDELAEFDDDYDQDLDRHLLSPE